MDLMPKLQLHEQEARRLRAEFSDDPLSLVLIEIDLAIRRAATRIGSLASAETAGPSDEVTHEHF